MFIVESTTDHDVALIRFTNPPVNGLSHALRSEISAALAQAIGDPAVKAIVLAGGDGMFSGGADIREFGTDLMYREPTLRDLIVQVEMSPKPVAVAIAGICLGGGFELALAAHHRIASKDAKLGLPEVKLGLLPGAGGTQRLPRLGGVQLALDMIVSGDPVSAAQLGVSSLLEKIVDGDPTGAAIEVARLSGRIVQPPLRTRDRRITDANYRELCDAARQRLGKSRLPAPRRAIDAIEASAGPFDAGLALERQAFLELMESPESKGLRHAFFAERAAAKVPGLEHKTARSIETAAVIGGGTMGSGIAICFLNAAIPVTLLETDQAALDRALARINAVYDGQVKKGKLSANERDRRLSLIKPTLDWADLRSADIAIEAVFESMDAKREVFTQLDRILKPGAILATNTSTLDINQIAAFTSRPQDVLGMHFFSPAHVMRLLEVVRAAATAPDALATALKLGRTLKKVPVVSGVCDGFIGNRMLEQYTRQAFALIEEGASPAQIDRAIEEFGIAMGPFRVADLVGNDVSWAIRKHRRSTRPGYQYSTLPDKLCELGRFGQKTSAGWYDYLEGSREPKESKVVSDLIEAHRRELNLTPQSVDDAEIVERLVSALASEGKKILDEGIALRASDIDVVYLTGYGFPAWRGGPMFYYEQRQRTE